MAASAFQAGSEVVVSGKEHTILRKISDKIWQLEEKTTRKIREFSDEELRALYVGGDLVFASGKLGDCASGKNFKDISKSELEVVKVRRAYVMAVIDLPATKSVVRPAIKAVWEKIHQPAKMPGTTAVMEWRADFIASGRDIFSLVPKTHLRGNRKSRYPLEVVEIVNEVIDQVFMTSERKTLQDVVDKATIRVERENQLRPDALKLPLPTRRMVARMVEAIPVFDKYAARYGRAAAMRKFRSVQGHRTTAIPLERAEIDHTPLDLMVVDDRTWMPLGRPHLTGCIDDFSRCILGIFISFEPPSYLSVARCLRDSFLPKSGLKERYPKVKNAWDAHGVMRELVVDNGAEFHSDSFETACWSLGIEIHYAPRKTGWFKAKIERFLGSVNRGVSHGTPGTTFSNIFEKDEYDPSKHAIIRLSTLQEMIRIWVVDYYHQKPHRALGVSPAAMWASNIKPEDILVPDDPARLDAILGRVEGRVLSHKGIELDGLFYNSPDLAELRRKHGDRLDVEIRIDDADIGKIIVLSPNGKQMFEAGCLSFEYANGLSRWQHQVCKRFAANNIGRSNPMAWLEAKETIANIIDEEFTQKRRKSAKKLARFQGVQSVQLPKPEAPTLPAALLPSSARPQPNESMPENPAVAPHSVSAPQPDQPKRPKKRFEPIIRNRSAATARLDIADDDN